MTSVCEPNLAAVKREPGVVDGQNDHLVSGRGQGIVIGWVLVSLLGSAALYRVIRTAVAHGIADAEEKRRKADRKS
jgi:hypothetical protein